MFRRLINWLAGGSKVLPERAVKARRRVAAQATTHINRAATAQRPQLPRRPAAHPPGLAARIGAVGPDNDVQVRNKLVREDTGTHETLKIVDDSIVQWEEGHGIDPYNSGEFDRSRYWDTRFRN